MSLGGLASRWRGWLPEACVAVLALAASVTSLRNGFAYDDVPIIVNNTRIHDWHHVASRFTQTYWPASFGGSLYRPLTMALFTMEWSLGNGSPALFHIVNVLLYAVVCVAVYRLARCLLPLGPALIAAACYAVHPVHVEVVANCVGQSELLVALVISVAVTVYLRQRTAGTWRGRDTALIGLLYAVGLMVKEHAIVLPALLVLAEFTVLADAQPASGSARVRALWPLGAALTTIAVGYLVVRWSVLGGVVGENPAMAFRDATWTTRWWTMLGVVPQWIRLLVWPAHLSAVYAPSGTPIRESADAVTFAGLAVLVTVAALALAARRLVPVLSFGLIWVGIVLLPVSNVIVKAGVLLAERTLFLPSVGAMLALGAVVTVAAGRLPAGLDARRTILAGAGAALAFVLAAGLVRSMVRGPVWHDDETLFEAAVQEDPLSYAGHYGYAGLLFNAGKRGSGEREARLALQLYDRDPRIYIDLATEYERAGDCAPAEVLARRALDLTSHLVSARLILGQCRFRARDFAGLRTVAAAGMADGLRPALFRQMLVTADSGARADTAGRP